LRTLASIKEIAALHPIEGKDRIELAIIDGWSVIVKKNEFQVGDKCVYCEIDSVLPEKPEFEFLRNKNFRIKTMKMGGVISQGICFPLSILPESEYKVGDDVTDIMGVKQHEPTMDREPKSLGETQLDSKKYPKWLMRFKWFRKLVRRYDKRGSKAFPAFVHKTDETRIQNIPFILKEKQPFVATEKIDGQSGTFCLERHKSKIPLIKDKFEYMVCSRNLRLFNKDNSSYWSVSDRYDIEKVLRKLIGNFDWIAIQGECIAPNVQGNKYKVKIPDLYVFNIITPEGRMSSLNAKNICEANGLKFVPIIDTSYILPDKVDKVLEYAHGKSALGSTLREGIVFRSQDGKVSFKAVDPLFLIKYDE